MFGARRFSEEGGKPEVPGYIGVVAGYGSGPIPKRAYPSPLLRRAYHRERERERERERAREIARERASESDRERARERERGRGT
jgi:hypothetical protein